MDHGQSRLRYLLIALWQSGRNLGERIVVFDELTSSVTRTLQMFHKDVKERTKKAKKD